MNSKPLGPDAEMYLYGSLLSLMLASVCWKHRQARFYITSAHHFLSILFAQTVSLCLSFPV